MAIDLEDFIGGETDYIAAMNSNNAILEAAISALQTATQFGTQLSVQAIFAALFGPVAILGSSSLGQTTSGSSFHLGSGYGWNGTTGTITYRLMTQLIDFSGKSAATYYITMDGGGAATISGTITDTTLYSVVWTGSAFGTVTQIAPIFFNAVDQEAMLTSITKVKTFPTVEARLEAIEQVPGITKVVIRSFDYTATDTDRGTFFYYTSAGLTFSLPTTPPLTPWVVYVQNLSTGYLTINPGSTLVDGGFLYKVDPGAGVIIISDTASYYTFRGSVGHSFLYGTSVPNAEGNDGDYYLDTATMFLYGPKASGTWPSGTALIGATGATGPTGPTGPAGGAGPTGPTGPAGSAVYAVDSGSANVYVGSGTGSLAAGLAVNLEIGHTNTGTSTFNWNSGGAVAIKIGTAALAGGELGAGKVVPLVYDGTVWQVTGGAAVVTRIRWLSAVPGKPTGGQYVAIYPVDNAATFPANFASPASYGTCKTNPTATAVYGVYKGITAVGTISISTSGVFTFATTSGVSFSVASGDNLTIVAPAVQDTTLSDVAFTLVSV